MIVLIVLLAIFIANVIVSNNRKFSTTVKEIAGNFAIITTILLIFNIIAVITWYITTNNEVEQYKVIAEKVAIYDKQKQDICEQIKNEATKYIAYEEKVFQSIKPDNVDILLTYYPQLRSVEVITQSINAIKEFNKLKYETQINAIDIKVKINTYNKNIFSFGRFDINN